MNKFILSAYLLSGIQLHAMQNIQLLQGHVTVTQQYALKFSRTFNIADKTLTLRLALHDLAGNNLELNQDYLITGQVTGKRTVTPLTSRPKNSSEYNSPNERKTLWEVF